MSVCPTTFSLSAGSSFSSRAISSRAALDSTFTSLLLVSKWIPYTAT